MASRLDLQNKLTELLGNPNVYYQSPGANGMSYPAIKYDKRKPDVKHADNIVYLSKNCYELIVIDYEPDNPVIETLMDLPYCSWDRHYIADNLNHDVLIIYY